MTSATNRDFLLYHKSFQEKKIFCDKMITRIMCRIFPFKKVFQKQQILDFRVKILVSKSSEGGSRDIKTPLESVKVNSVSKILQIPSF